jgi:hypothetical protein
MEHLPKEIINTIFNFCDVKECYKNISLVNHQWHLLTLENDLFVEWKIFYLKCLKNHHAIWSYYACEFGLLKILKFLANKECLTPCYTYFLISCINGHFDVARWIFETTKINIHHEQEKVFLIACKRGHHHILKYLIELGKIPEVGLIDIHAQNNTAFDICCVEGHLKIAKWLLKISNTSLYTPIDIHHQQETPYRLCLTKKNKEMMRWLLSLDEYSSFDHNIVRPHLQGVYDAD